MIPFHAIADSLNRIQSAAPAQDAKPADGGAAFSDLLRSAVRETGDLQAKASQQVSGLLNGTGVDVHQAMIATQKADLAFELALQVRNKAVAAYQQMMQMQF